jgi:Ca2+-binding RTX toxin-like protein
LIDLSHVYIASFIHGGAGNDTLIGGSGDDVIVGGSADDHITGGAGHDFLVGGAGMDRIVGSSGHDVLLAGDVGSNLGLHVLREISKDWVNTRTAYESAVDDLIDVVFADGDYDVLTGGSGADLFIIDSGDKITDFRFDKPNTNKDGDIVVKDGNLMS